MTVNTVAHLNFHGNAREALGFYQSVFGGHSVIATYSDFGLPKDLPDADKVVFGQIAADNGVRLMAYDIPSQAERTPAGPTPTPTRREHGVTLTSEPFFLSVRGDTVDEVKALWDKLSENATIIEPFGPAQWAPGFGMLTDRFGITWILDVAAAY
jgi:PhnB protein